MAFNRVYPRAGESGDSLTVIETNWTPAPRRNRNILLAGSTSGLCNLRKASHALPQRAVGISQACCTSESI